MAEAFEPNELISRERDLIAYLRNGRTAWKFQRGSRGGTQSLESFRYALTMPDAPVAFAMLRAYISAVRLDRSEDWNVSAMPNWVGPTGGQRFATVNGGSIELFFVEFEPSSGRVVEWGARFPHGRAPRVPDPDRLWHGTAKNGEPLVHGAALGDLLTALDDPEFRSALIAAFDERATTRRADWHNPYLGAALSADDAPLEAEAEPVTHEAIEFERRYIEHVTRTRLHQTPLRGAALRHYKPVACHYCGLDVLEVIDAAHIVPDSEGGAASVDNVRLLCANHHRAFDRGLLTWESEKNRFVRTPGKPDVPPASPR